MTFDPTNPIPTSPGQAAANVGGEFGGGAGLTPADRARLDDLLCDCAVEGLDGLTEADAAELRELLARAGQSEEGFQGIDLAAAAFERALFAGVEAQGADVQVPQALLRALEREGQAWSAGVSAGVHAGAQAGVNSDGRGVLARLGAAPVRTVTGAVASVMESRTVRGPMVMSRRYLREWSGWIAAAACLGLAFVTWQRATRGPAVDNDSLASGGSLASSGSLAGGGGVQTANLLPANLVPADLLRPVERFAEDLGLRATQRLQRFMNDPYSDLVIVPIGDAKPIVGDGVSVGEVVWNRADGSGVLRLRVADGTAARGGHYQLWIFDTARNEHQPVDGGVIEVRAGQLEVLAPIDPSLPIGRAAAFAVTRELAGGAVVSSRQRMVAVGVAEGMAPPPVFEDEPVVQVVPVVPVVPARVR